MTIADFVHLRIRSPYSLLRGAMRIPDIIKLCKQHSMPAAAITDMNNLFGSLEFSEYAMKEGIQPIIGTTLSLLPMDADIQNLARVTPDELLLIAKNDAGYANLLKLSSMAYTDPVGGHAPLLSYDLLRTHSDGLIALTSGQYGGIGRALLGQRPQEAERLTLELLEMFGDRLYIELMRHNLEPERQIEKAMIDLALKHHIPLVATNHVHFAAPEMVDAHDALLCVADGRYVSEPDRTRLNDAHHFKSPKEMKLLFADIPEAIENTLRIARRCAVVSPSRAPILPGFSDKNEAGEAINESEALALRARAGLEARLQKHVFTSTMSDDEKADIAKPYYDRLEFELDVIITMKFPGYFLIVSDFITWAKAQSIPVGPGRGSGAGSVVAWALLITDLDPLKFGLIFERFLNPERVSMPDFDIDFCQDRRDEVIRYVQQKYGDDRVAQIITFGKLQARAVLRDVGRVLQMPYGQVDKICKLVPNNPAAPVTLDEALKLEPELRRMMREEEIVHHLVTIALQLEGLYRHASTHAAGVVIADRPLDELVPIYRDPKSTMPVVQYSMKYAENAGLVKFDFLGLKTLSVLQTTVNLLAKRGIAIDLTTLPENDPATYAMLAKGDTVGVFQFESAGMQDALRKLKPDSLEDLIALGALYRPGPMDNIPTYIAVKHGKEKPDYLHPMLEDVLRETYGVIIYQEQVQKIAQIMGGYTLGGADLLRRAMGKKIKSEMDAQREAFAKGAEENGVPAAQASMIFDLVAKFAGYGFNKSHAAAYAVIAYQTAYLKANYPVEFIAASMSYDQHNTDKLSIFRQEAQKFGIAVLPPDVNRSSVAFDVEPHGEGYAICYALAAVRNVGSQAMQALVDERTNGGPYRDIFDFVNRLDASAMNRRQFEHLIMAGAFDSLNQNRRQLMESVDLLMGLNLNATRDRISNQGSLFGDHSAAPAAAMNLPACEDWPTLERLGNEFSAIGFYLSAHPLEAYGAMLQSMGITTIEKLSAKLGSTYQTVRLAGIVTAKKTKVSPKGKFAFVQLSDATGIVEISVFDEKLLNQSAALLEPGSMIVMKADGKQDDGGVRLIAQEITALDTLQSTKRDSQLHIQLRSSDDLERIKSLLGPTTGNATRIHLSVSLPKHRVRVAIPHHYNVTAQTAGIIGSLPSVAGLEWA